MLDHFKSLTISQYKAALKTLESCVVECPESQWSGKVANNSFSQSAFHTLFFADVYLCQNLDELKEQEFHKRHVADFGAYEELEFKTPEMMYSKDFVKEYLEFCRQRAELVVTSETEDDFKTEADFPWLEISRAELHTYNIRHIQHHVAQLIMRLRLDTPADIGWVKNG